MKLGAEVDEIAVLLDDFNKKSAEIERISKKNLDGNVEFTNQSRVKIDEVPRHCGRQVSTGVTPRAPN